MTALVVILTSFLLPTHGGAAAAQEPQSSARSRDALSRVKPGLEQALADMGTHYGAPIFIRVFKEEMELELWVVAGEGFALFRTYDICAGSGVLGPKLREGDLQCPEGFYYVSPRGLNPLSAFHLSFDIGYPNAYDRSLGRTGSAIMVHGNCVSIGCFAMTDERIEEIYALADAALRGGQSFFRVHVFPFRMTDQNMNEHEDSDWRAFWVNLKQGYDHFEVEGHPPDVNVAGGSYVFAQLDSGRDWAARLVEAAMERTEHRVRYDGSYRSIDYPLGDVPDNRGVCTDLVVRAYRVLGVDLQQEVHEDMVGAFSEYPNIWGHTAPDPNIDHRRVPNLQVFFRRHGEELAVTDVPANYQPGDLVTWMLPGNLPHIGIVTNRRSPDAKRPLIVHNIGRGPKIEDTLFEYPITGHYRFEVILTVLHLGRTDTLPPPEGH